MPYRTTWMNPEVFHAAKRVRVYYTYHDDDFARGPTPYWFTLHPQCELDRTRCHQDCCPHIFDVRELSTWRPLPTSGATIAGNLTVNPAAKQRDWQRELKSIRTAIQAAIKTGELTPDGVQPPQPKPRRRPR